ncbi:MAG: nucleotide exchange factor GrpE [Blastocatellia bacterium]
MSKKDNEPKEIPIQFSDNDEEQVDSDGPELNDAPADDPTGKDIDRLAALQSQVDALTQERSMLLDQRLRTHAEFENYRRRVERERAETYARSRAEVVLELLPVIDNFERALASLEHNSNDAASLRQGIELIHRQLNDALSKFGLEPVETVGHAFDPHLHEAVSAEPSEEHEENTVIAEFQRGYKLGEKLLRPAKVKVAASPEK